MEHRINNNEINQIFYKYIKLDRYTIVDLINKKLFLSQPKNFNDPFDCPIFRGNIYKKYKSFSNVIDRILVSCFSNNYESILMWSHYADSHKGICVGYRITSEYCKENNILLDKVNYQNSNKSNKDIIDFKGLLNETFFIKNTAWEYENEYRLVAYNLKNNKICSPPIEEIIFGINTSDEDIDLITNIFKANRDITYKKIIEKENDNINLDVEILKL